MSVALVDYGAGNLTSVRKALGALGAGVTTPRRPEELAGASAIIVPGVGHFGQTGALDERWRGAIRAAVDGNIPLLGICLGMQWLYEGSEEAPAMPGLGIFSGTCGLLEGTSPREGRLKVPHVGWNRLDITRSAPLVGTIQSGAQAYFTHSYAAPVTDDTVAVTSHGAAFASIVSRGLVFGAQFHPEKSGQVGLAILRGFLDLCSDPGAKALLRADSRPRVPQFTPRPGLPALSKRIIACLDVRDGVVVKGVQFEGLAHAGDPALLARRYNAEGIDEVVILDVTATLERRRALAETIRAVAGELFIPLTVGGGIRTEDDAAAVIDAGADKVSLNTAALRDPTLITTLARRYGSQAVVVAIDAKRRGRAFEVYARSATVAASRDAVEWAVEASRRGAGEILLTSIDRDGTRAGFDCGLTAAVSRSVPIPVIASGGAGTFEHFREVFTAGRADAALAASVFHFGEHAVSELKLYLASHGLPVRRS